jgi:hypothetical protein
MEAGILNSHERLLLHFRIKESGDPEYDRRRLADLLSRDREQISEPPQDELLANLRSVMNAETLPERKTLLRIGRALVASRLDHITPDLVPNNGTLAESDARQLFYAITHFEGTSDAPVFRDKAHASRTFKELEEETRWHHVRDLLGRLVHRIRQELSERNPFALEGDVLQTGRIATGLTDSHHRARTTDLGPDEFDFSGVRISGFTSKQLRLLRLVQTAGTAGVPVPEALKALKYKNHSNGRKSLQELRRRTQIKVDRHEPPAGWMFVITNDRLHLTRISGRPSD